MRLVTRKGGRLERGDEDTSLRSPSGWSLLQRRGSAWEEVERILRGSQVGSIGRKRELFVAVNRYAIACFFSRLCMRFTRSCVFGLGMDG